MKEVELSSLFPSEKPTEPIVLMEDGKPSYVIYPVSGIPKRDLEMILGILQRRREPGWQPD